MHTSCGFLWENRMKTIKRYLFYCNSCGFEYGSPSKEPCSCSLCGAVNECCYVDEVEVEE